MTGPGMILTGQLSALGMVGVIAVCVALWPARVAGLRGLRAARRRAAAVRTRLDQLRATQPQRLDPRQLAAGAARLTTAAQAHGRHARIPHQRTSGDA